MNQVRVREILESLVRAEANIYSVPECKEREYVKAELAYMRQHLERGLNE